MEINFVITYYPIITFIYFLNILEKQPFSILENLEFSKTFSLDTLDELQNLNIDDGNYAVIYKQHQDYKNFIKIITFRPLYAIDATRHPENISNSLSRTDNIIAYVVVISEKVF